MTGSTRSSDGLDTRRRRLLFRAWHRGNREMDLIMGRFADAHVGTLSEREVDEFERLIPVPDADLYAWIAGQAEIPPDYDCDLLRRLCAFHSAGRDPT
jgi:antitoxin CptB